MNPATGVKTVTKTTSAGVYNFPQVNPAVYELEAEATGFKKAVVKSIQLGVLQRMAVDIKLELGSVTESVTVASEAPLLNPTSAAIGTNIAPREYQDLPIFFGGAFRSALGLINLLPGVNPAKYGTHISGGQAFSRDFQLDGVSVTTTEIQGDGRGWVMPVDTLQEFSVVTNSFSAEFGRTGGGIESYTLKSGTNQLHGSAYDYIRNEAFDARGFYPAKRGVYKQHDGGATVGGPVVIPKIYNGRDKTFFFFAAGVYRQANVGASMVGTVPTLKMRQGIFTEKTTSGGAPFIIYDPTSTANDASGNLTRTPFGNQTIPSSRFSKVAQNVQAFFPNPTRDGWFNNYDGWDKGSRRQTNFTWKIDHNIGSKHKIAGSASLTYFPDIPVALLPNPISGKRDTIGNAYVLRATHDWVVTPTMVNHLALGFNRYLVQTAGENNGVDWYQKMGYTGAKTGVLWGFPGFSVSDIGGFGGGGGFGTFDNTYNMLDSFSWTKGKHSIKMGFEIRRLQNNSVNPGNGPSSVITQGATALPNQAAQTTTGQGWASFLLGEVYQTGFFINDVTNGPRWGQYMSYIQDDWKVTPNLTLNIGLRYEVPRPFYDVNQVMTTIDMNKPNPAAGNLPGVLIFGKDWYKQTGQKSFMDTPWNEISPRLGIAYRLPKDAVLRVAYSIFYNAGFGLGNGFRGSTAGYSINSTAAASNVWESRWNLDKPFVIDFAMPPFLDPSFGVNTSSSFSAITRDLGKSAYIQSWNVGLQKQLRGGFVAEVDYVGNKGTRLPSLRFSGKQLPPWYFSAGDLLNKNIRDPAVAAAGFKPPWDGFRSTTLARALSMLPQYDRFTPNVADGMSTYHSIQLKLQRRFTNGFSFLGSYTLGKMLTDTNSQLLRPAYGSVTARDSYHREIDKAISPDDRTHVVSIAAMYELPFGPGKPLLKSKGPLKFLVGGWQLNAVLSY
ncbi:MAG: carboxypeptidase regulatory-like domain-containing protein, partial [Bryobacteraceae bacterium]